MRDTTLVSPTRKIQSRNLRTNVETGLTPDCVIPKLLTVLTVDFEQGYEPFISASTIHQLHIFIVVLALVHVVYSCLTLGLALSRVRTTTSICSVL